MVGAAAHYLHGAQAAGEVAEDLCLSMFYQRHCGLCAGFPTIINTESLRAEAAFWKQGESKMEHLLADNSTQTPVAAGDGHFPGLRAQPRQGQLYSTTLVRAADRNFPRVLHASSPAAVDEGGVFFLLAVGAHLGGGPRGVRQATTYELGHVTQ
jgi:hypothetical protein